MVTGEFPEVGYLPMFFFKRGSFHNLSNMLFLCRWRDCLRGQADLEASARSWPISEYAPDSKVYIEWKRTWIVGDHDEGVDRLWHVLDVKRAPDIGFIKRTLCNRYDYIKRITKKDIDKEPYLIHPARIKPIVCPFTG